ncbi:MAG: DUF1501 domain-containing protein [Planctomycetota bacterium]|nr:MAG: DUF1501 domain-containing protein [Planctomycetota bacterium]
MLTLLSSRRGSFCDGISRRQFLRIGSLAAGGLSLPKLLRAEAVGQAEPTRSLIMIYLPGGPTQHETFDPKPAAPSEIRGPYGTVRTGIPGVAFGQWMPKLAARTDRFSIVRTLVGMQNRHESYQCYTGRPGGRDGDNEPAGGWPGLGSVASHVLGSGPGGIVPYVDAGPKMSYRPYNNAGYHDASGKISWPGFTGRRHTPFALDGEGQGDLVLNGVDLARLQDRRALLAAFSNYQRQVRVEGLDSFQQQAFDILTSSRLAEAMDLDREDPAVRERYGKTQLTDPSFGGAPQSAEHLLLARRLVEAGVRVVSVAFGAWDWHANREGSIEHLAKKYLPVFDHAIDTLLDDLHQRGLSEHVSVVVWGEFGRTPRINAKGGRDHWPGTQSVLLAGGGMQGGRIIGETDKSGGEPADRPVHVQEVFATLYRNLGIDVNTVKIPDLSGRPRYLVDDNRQPIAELY